MVHATTHAAFDHIVALEHFEMFGYCRRRHRELGGDLTDGQAAAREPLDNTPARWVTQCRKDSVHLRPIVNHMVNYKTEA